MASFGWYIDRREWIVLCVGRIEFRRSYTIDAYARNISTHRKRWELGLVNRSYATMGGR